MIPSPTLTCMGYGFFICISTLICIGIERLTHRSRSRGRDPDLWTGQFVTGSCQRKCAFIYRIASTYIEGTKIPASGFQGLTNQFAKSRKWKRFVA
jgi:hypothetical protein